MVAQVIVAGHETAVNLLDQAFAALLTHPDQLDRVRAGDSSWNDDIDETLWWQAPVANLPLRYTIEDIQVDGVINRAGDAILASFAAAGRDPDHHPEHPESFDIHRPNKERLAFGHRLHFCLRAQLARLKAEVALPALFGRFPDMSLAVALDELRPVESFISNGHRRLPVVMRPA
ncbi:cytochrome P450 [Streptomyces sp. JNUCC 63]